MISYKTIRNKKLKDLADCVKRCAATDLIVAGDFNESFGSENITNFMSEPGLHDVFAEINGVKIENRGATCQHGREHIDHGLATEGMLSKETGIILIECSEKVESNHRGCLTDTYFSE